MSDLAIWGAIVLCVSQSATFSGLNLAMFGVSRLQLEVEVSTGNRSAAKVLALRKDSNFLLTTILWGNVAVNCLLTLFSESVLAGAAAFLFSTVVITFLGEIIPQAYFSRHALRMAALLTPVLRFYQIVLYPVAKPSALLLDAWLGEEGIQFLQERDLREVIRKHVESEEADVDLVEGQGALNFLSMDDLPVSRCGEAVDPASVLDLELKGDNPNGLPSFKEASADPFLQRVHSSGKKWVVLTDLAGEPRFVLDADGFLRDALLSSDPVDLLSHCHRPIVVRNQETLLGNVIGRMMVRPENKNDYVIDHDLILVWDETKRIITGADLLGLLLRGIVPRLSRVEP